MVCSALAQTCISSLHAQDVGHLLGDRKKPTTLKSKNTRVQNKIRGHMWKQTIRPVNYYTGCDPPLTYNWCRSIYNWCRTYIDLMWCRLNPYWNQWSQTFIKLEAKEWRTNLIISELWKHHLFAELTYFVVSAAWLSKHSLILKTHLKTLKIYCQCSVWVGN